MARQRLTVKDAAEALGTTVDAVRSRIRRGSLDSEKDPEGRVYVWLDADQSGDEPKASVEGSAAEDLREQVRYLREQLRREQDAHAEARRLLAGALERIPQIEAPATEARGSSVSPEEPSPAPTPGEDRPG
ncbi:MAG: hypothetical protein ACRDTR_14495, partial [Rubrobacter sp.]